MGNDLPVRPRDSFLRTAIRLDAAGVGLIGLGIAGFAGPFARLTGLATGWAYGIAAAFLFYGVAGNWLAGRTNIRPIGTGLSLFNFVGAVGQTAIVPAGVLPLTGTGKAVMVAFGLYALLFGVLQLMGLRRLA
ncbi:MAG: hypothetical protein KIH64_004155 [Mycobacterium sp.]|nr:hypothetical protein [Mycobacterium sp.]